MKKDPIMELINNINNNPTNNSKNLINREITYDICKNYKKILYSVEHLLRKIKMKMMPKIKGSQTNSNREQYLRKINRINKHNNKSNLVHKKLKTSMLINRMEYKMKINSLVINNNLILISINCHKKRLDLTPLPIKKEKLRNK